MCELTEKKNKKVMVEYLKTVFSKVGTFDPAAGLQSIMSPSGMFNLI